MTIDEIMALMSSDEPIEILPNGEVRKRLTGERPTVLTVSKDLGGNY